MTVRALLVVAGLLATTDCKRSDASAPDPMVERARADGRVRFFGRAGCTMCHKVGTEGAQIVGPNLGVADEQTVPVGVRARRDGVRGIEYVVESIVDPDAFVAPGYVRGVMRRYEEPPISLTDDEIVALATFVAGQGPGAPPLDSSALLRARERIAVTRRTRAPSNSGAPSN
jgi:mono/diheme cytochrome c family protein